ncbi:uncharacterized protein LOC118186133 isoform X2 [Stegodyphus dumicola]|uniref:uncharacterized protein LOC118186133 isoform X2 n=1 Tax=Stegodyphus dumicola TaxID=202533 RepID=UPI0015ABA160|nr:uncharacterized protein LOC118186133 isoform X2 [Stegodyphus dumicola]
MQKILELNLIISTATIGLSSSVIRLGRSLRTSMAPSHIFQDPCFWQHFQRQVKSKAWKCNFSPEILIENIDKDSALYKDDTILKKRRQGLQKWIKNDTQWIKVILGTCKEIANGEFGHYSQTLKKFHILDAFRDFVDHLNWFYIVAAIMADKGQEVHPISQNSSEVHDIDKLDPIMLIGYSEKFEDDAATSVWNTCVYRHVHFNPHHQAHSLWHEESQEKETQVLRTEALREMVCDKVSRNVQKTLIGEISDKMWKVDLTFFNGLPQEWIDLAVKMMDNLS